MRFGDFKQELLEGVYDPGIFKAFFLAGGAGSGKSYSAEKATGSAAGKFEWHEDMNKLKPGKTGPYGLKVVNSDEQLEYGLMKAEMSLNMRSYTDIETEKKDTNLFDIHATEGSLLIFNESGVHRGAALNKTDRLCLRYAFIHEQI